MKTEWGGGVDYLTALQTSFRESLPGLVAAGAWVCWARASQARDDRQARASERETSSFKLWLIRGGARRPAPLKAGVVAVLVSTPEKVERVRHALGERFRLYFASTWRELQRAVRRLAPCAIVVDPAADTEREGEGEADAERHLLRLTAEGLTIMLYVTLTSQSAGMLLRLGRLGIRDVAFHRYDDRPERFIAVCNRGSMTGPPSPRAA